MVVLQYDTIDGESSLQYTRVPGTVLLYYLYYVAS